MALDRSKLHKGFQTYLANAEKASGRTYEDFALLLSASGLKKHGELRSYLMEKAGLGHGHANAVVAIWLLPGAGGPAQPVKKPAAKAPGRPAKALVRTPPSGRAKPPAAKKKK